jgi:hypothetical protein
VLKTRKDSDSHSPPSPRRGPTGLHRTRFGKMKKIPAIEIKFPLHLSLSIALMSEDKRSARWQEDIIPKTTGKRVIKRHDEKLLIYTAFER